MTELSIVTSMYNEEDNAKEFLNGLLSAAKQFKGTSEIVAVDNGGSDNTGKICNDFHKRYPNKIKIIHAPKPTIGKGNGVRLGIEKSDGKYIALIDSDLEYDAMDILKVLDVMKKENLDVIIGWRKDRKHSFYRKFVSKFYNKLVYILFRIPVPDIGSSPRIFKREFIKNYGIKNKKWLIEVELPYVALKRGAKIGYYPVHHRARIGGESNIKFFTIFQMFKDLLVLRLSDFDV